MKSEMKLQQVDMDSLYKPTPEEQAQIDAEHAQEEKTRAALMRIHMEAHPEWDDMQFTAWCKKQDLADLHTMKTHLDYMSTYITYAIEAKKASAE